MGSGLQYKNKHTLSISNTLKTHKQTHSISQQHVYQKEEWCVFYLGPRRIVSASLSNYSHLLTESERHREKERERLNRRTNVPHKRPASTEQPLSSEHWSLISPRWRRSRVQRPAGYTRFWAGCSPTHTITC